MKKLKLRDIHDIFVDSVNRLDGEILNKLKEIKLDYQQNIIEEKIKLLIEICNGEGLDVDKIKSKYLKPKEINLIIPDDVKDETETEENIMDKIELNGKQYYYENKERGIVYDMSSKPVGIYKNGSIILE